MNVYDFDGTIYNGDSTVDFYFFCVKTNPLLIRFLPKQLSGLLKYALKLTDKTALKENFFCFLNGIKNPQEKVALFWEHNYGKIYSWYLSRKKSTDVVISASPYFLLKPVCDKLEISKLIASDVDISTGHFYGANCHGKEKVIRFEKCDFGEAIDEFYSDSLSDLPMANIAKQAFFVKNGVVRKRNDN